MMPFNNYFPDFINLFKILDEKVKVLNYPDGFNCNYSLYRKTKQ